MLFSIFSTLILVVFQTIIANKTNSLALKAERAHYIVDFLTNGTVIISLLFVKYFNFYYFDVIAALFISIYLLYNAYVLAAESIEQITDIELSPEIKKQIEKIVINSDGIRGMHDFRSRNLGGIFYFEMHLEIDGNLPLSKAHYLSDIVENKILDLYPNSQILIHQDPYGIKEDRLDHKINGTCDID
jgi:ferrous-iron efflux pump FieF